MQNSKPINRSPNSETHQNQQNVIGIFSLSLFQFIQCQELFFYVFSGPPPLPPRSGRIHEVTIETVHGGSSVSMVHVRNVFRCERNIF